MTTKSDLRTAQQLPHLLEINIPLSKQRLGHTQEHEIVKSIHARGHQALISQSPSMPRPGP